MRGLEREGTEPGGAKRFRGGPAGFPGLPRIVSAFPGKTKRAYFVSRSARVSARDSTSNGPFPSTASAVFGQESVSQNR